MSSTPGSSPFLQYGRRSDAPGTQREVQPLFDALEDADCRQILGALADESFTAKEVSDACGLPLSTTYRKLGLLTDGDLVEEGTRILPDGRHVTEYARVVDDVAISVGGATGLEISVSYREPVDRCPFYGSRPGS